MKLSQVKHKLLTKEIVITLKNNNVATVKEFLSNNPLILNEKCNLLTFDSIFQLRSDLARAYGPPPILQENPNESITTNLLDLKKNYIYEIFGPPGAGKTQFCLTMAAEVANKFGHVLYVDTKNDFSSNRLKSILRNNEDMKNVHLAKAFDLNQAIKLTNEIATHKHANISPKLLVLDNIANLIWPLIEDDDFSMMELFLPIGKLIRNLRKIARDFQLPVVIVNNTIERGTRPALGKFFERVADVRLRISDQQIVAHKSVDNLSDLKFNVVVTEKGMVKIDNNEYYE